MADILKSAQPTDSTMTVSPPDQQPAEGSPPLVEPQQESSVSSSVPPEPPPAPMEEYVPAVKPEPVKASSFDSLIVPRVPEAPKKSDIPDKAINTGSNIPSSGVPKRRKSKTGIILAVLLLLLITLPLAVYFISQQQRSISDVRSRAEEVYPSCPNTDCQIDSTIPRAIHCTMPGYPNGTYCCPSDTPLFQSGQCVTISSQYKGCCPKDNSASAQNTCSFGLTEPVCGAQSVCTKLYTPNTTCPTITPPPSGTCPLSQAAGTACDKDSTLGSSCKSDKGNEYCCVINLSGSHTWAPNTWGSCPVGGIIPNSCPWPLTGGKCCPTNGDACDYTAGQTKCIADPFNSNCVKWNDGSCLGGGGVWQAQHWYSDCKTEGCGGNANLVCVDNAGGTGVNLCRNKNCLQDTDCVCAGTPTEPPTSPGAPQCTRIHMYKDGTDVTNNPSVLRSGDIITITVNGANSTKAHVRVNGGEWKETTTNSNGVFTIDNILLPTTDLPITIEAETLGSDNQWY